MTSRSEQVVVAFDLYGTLLSTESVATELTHRFGKADPPKIVALWRQYQLEYTWRLNSMKQYQPFSEITCNSLEHALRELQVPYDDLAPEDLKDVYYTLSTFPDVAPALEKLRDVPWITPVIFSNGTSDMIEKSVNGSPELSSLKTVFKESISVEEVECFKPDPAVYYHLAKRMGKTKAEMGSMWLVSGNPFDIVGANAVGMKTAWVKRKGEKWIDGLVQVECPTYIAKDLGEMVEWWQKMIRPS